MGKRLDFIDSRRIVDIFDCWQRPREVQAALAEQNHAYPLQDENSDTHTSFSMNTSEKLFVGSRSAALMGKLKMTTSRFTPRQRRGTSAKPVPRESFRFSSKLASDGDEPPPRFILLKAANILTLALTTPLCL